MSKKLTSVAFIVLLLITGKTWADDLVAIKACAQIEDSLKRLVCYDESVNTLIAKQAQISQKKTDIKPEKTKPSVKKQPDITSEKTPTPVDKKEQFGIEHVQNKQKQAVEEIEDQDVIYIVKSLDKNIKKRWVITFENGQVWQQNDSEYLKLSAGDTVILSKGLFGAIHLKKDGSNRRIKVRRQK